MTINPQDDVSIVQDFYKEMKEIWDRSNSLLGGTDAMRKQGKKYLPQFPEESEVAWGYRKNTAFLHNMYRKQINSMIGHIFKKEIEFDDEFPFDDGFIEDVDLNGNSIDMFMQNVARDVLTKGFSIIFVDNPTDVSDLMLADIEQRGIRPYWTRIEPESVIGGIPEIQGGVEVIRQFRWYESAPTQDGEFSVINKKRIRCITPVIVDETDENGVPIIEDGVPKQREFLEWRVYEQANGGKGEWEIVERGEFGLPVVSIAIIYADKVDWLVSRVAFDDIAWKNIEHWQSSSDQRNILTRVRFPVRFEKGTDEPSQALGPQSVVHTKNPDAVLEFVQPPTEGVDAGWKDLDRIEQEIETISLEMRVEPSGETATGRIIDRLENMSPLQRIAHQIQVGGNLALYFTALFAGKENGGSMKINKDFGVNTDEKFRLQQLTTMRTNKDLSRITYLEEVKKLGGISEDVDPEQEDAALQAENELMLRDFGDDGSDNNDPSKDERVDDPTGSNAPDASED